MHEALDRDQRGQPGPEGGERVALFRTVSVNKVRSHAPQHRPQPQAVQRVPGQGIPRQLAGPPPRGPRHAGAAADHVNPGAAPLGGEPAANPAALRNDVQFRVSAGRNEGLQQAGHPRAGVLAARRARFPSRENGKGKCAEPCYSHRLLPRSSRNRSVRPAVRPWHPPCPPARCFPLPEGAADSTECRPRSRGRRR